MGAGFCVFEHIILSHFESIKFLDFGKNCLGLCGVVGGVVGEVVKGGGEVVRGGGGRVVEGKEVGHFFSWLGKLGKNLH